MKIQITQTKPLIFRIDDDDDEYQFFKPSFLYRNFSERITGKVKGSTLGWNIKHSFLTYNKIKKACKYHLAENHLHPKK